MTKYNKLPLNKIIVILGPTSAGKSAVAIKLAQKFDGEVVSVDSRQIYRGMDVGTGKVTQDKISNFIRRGGQIKSNCQNPKGLTFGFWISFGILWILDFGFQKPRLSD